MKAIAFIGNSGAGKTTLIERLIVLLAARGLRVSAVKHAHHGFDMDRPGKDSHRFRAAGAGQVMVCAGERWALLTETPREPARLPELLSRLDDCDLVLIEGFRYEGEVPRIELRRAGVSALPLNPADPHVIAVASDTAVDTRLPVFDLNDAAKIAEFIVVRLGPFHDQP